MSVVVWDGVTLACDSDMNDGQVKLPFKKIWEQNWGKFRKLYGVCGPIHECMKLRAWVEQGLAPAEFPELSLETHLVEVTSSLAVFRYTNNGILNVTGKLAVGSGRDFAYGAMFMGANAEEAVRAAIKYSASCSGEVIRLEGQPSGKAQI